MNPSFPTQQQQNLYNNIPPQLHQLTPLTNALQGPPEAERPRRPLSPSTPSSQRRESDEARAKRLAENAERMRQKRAAESFDQYKARLAKNAEANRRRRLNESSEERQMRLAKGAARARMRWLNETPEQRSERNRMKAEYTRMFRNSSPQDLTATRYALTHPAAAAAAAAAAASSADNRVKAEHPPPQIESLNTPNPAPISQPHSNSALASAPPAPPPTSSTSAQNYAPVKNHPVVTQADFGAAFSTFFNHPHLKNGQPNAAAAYGPTPVAIYPSQTGYPLPELTVPNTPAAATYVKNVPRPKNPSSRAPAVQRPTPSKSSTAAQKH